jgi:hypothetical protein
MIARIPPPADGCPRHPDLRIERCVSTSVPKEVDGGTGPRGRASSSTVQRPPAPERTRCATRGRFRRVSTTNRPIRPTLLTVSVGLATKRRLSPWHIDAIESIVARGMELRSYKGEGVTDRNTGRPLRADTRQ